MKHCIYYHQRRWPQTLRSTIICFTCCCFISVSRPKAADGSVIAKQVVQKREVKIKKKLDDDDVSKNKANKKCTNASTSKTLSSSSDESDDEVLLRQLVRKSTGKDKVSSSNINTSKSDPISKTPNTNVTKKNVTFAEETIVPTCNNKTNDNDISPDADATINSLNDNMSAMLAPSPNPTNTTNKNMPSQSTSTNGISKTGVPYHIILKKRLGTDLTLNLSM